MRICNNVVRTKDWGLDVNYGLMLHYVLVEWMLFGGSCTTATMPSPLRCGVIIHCRVGYGEAGGVGGFSCLADDDFD